VEVKTVCLMRCSDSLFATEITSLLLVGPLTDAAIREFQKAETGLVDGRVDRDGPTIRKLEYLHVVRVASEIQSLEHYGMMSLTPPLQGPVTLMNQANEYLCALRRSQG
jgi:hypothetical protein